ncbi:hypothetical protein PHMEG_00031547, partial [Phytophthora megakarya]
LSPRRSGVAAGHRNSSNRPSVHRMSLTLSFISTYSVSVLEWALVPCFREPYEIALPSRKVM